MADSTKTTSTPTKPSSRRRWFINSIRARLLLSFVLVGVLFFIATVISFWRTSLVLSYDRRSTEIYQPLFKNVQEVVKAMEEGTEKIKLRVYVISNLGDSTDLERRKINNAIDEIWQDRAKLYLDSLQILTKQINNQDLYTLTEIFVGTSKKINFSFGQALELAGQPSFYVYKNPEGKSEDIRFFPLVQILLKNDIEPQLKTLKNTGERIIERTRIIRNSEEALLDYNLNLFFISEIVVYIIIVILIIVLIKSLIDYIIGDLRGIYRYLKDAANGNIPQIPEGYSREFNIISSELVKLRKELTTLRDFALKVAKGEYTTKKMIFSGQGSLGSAVQKMSEGLKKVSEDNEIRYWHNNGLALFSEVLRNNADDLQHLAERFITELVKYLGAHQGLFFLVEEDNHEEFLEYKASYAYHQDQIPTSQKLRPGQGLSGQVWKEKEASYYEEIPEKYFFHISSGLGESIPRVLLAFPLINNAKVLGVIEIGSFEKIPEYKQQFAQEVGYTLAASLATTRSNERTKKLLIESQKLTESLRRQEEQVKEKVKELERTQILMSKAQKELAQKEANLEGLINNTSNAILAFDRKYNITVINRAMRAIYLADGIVLKAGKNLLEELPQKDIQKHRQEYERALAGEKFDIIRSSQRYDGKYFYKLNYNPIRNANNEIIGASIFIENITERKRTELALQEVQAYLQAILNDTEDAVVIVDNDFNVLLANEEYTNYWKNRGIKVLHERANILQLYIDYEERQQWKTLFERAFKDERFMKMIEIGEFPEKTYIENWFNPIANEEGKIVGVVLMSRDISRLKKSEMHIKQLLLDSLEATEKMQKQEMQLQKEIARYKARIKELENRVHS